MTGIAEPLSPRANAAENALGAGIRAERQRQGLTLAHVAEQAGLSQSALSQIERGITDPSIGSLRRIATALEVPFFHFLMQPEEPDVVVRRDARRTIRLPERQLEYHLLMPTLRGPFEVLSLNLAPGAASGAEALGHDSEECMVILCGRVDVEVAGQTHTLHAGDSVYIQRNLPHRAVNNSPEPVEILMVIQGGWGLGLGAWGSRTAPPPAPSTKRTQHPTPNQAPSPKPQAP